MRIGDDVGELVDVVRTRREMLDQRGAGQTDAFDQPGGESALAELEDLLEFAKARGVVVIGYLPSYAPDLWRRMVARGNHAYILALTPFRLFTSENAY